jgi:hypothetical protein
VFIEQEARPRSAETDPNASEFHLPGRAQQSASAKDEGEGDCCAKNSECPGSPPKHFGEQNELVDLIAERIMMLGGVSIAMSADVAETTLIPRPPSGREEVPVQISRLLHAHEIVLKEARAMARKAEEEGDDGTNDLLISNVIRTHEMQVWFVAEHLVDGPLVRADGQAGNS